MYLAFDTETTGLLSSHHDLNHIVQPHILQFAGIVFDRDGQEVDRLITLVKPGPSAILFPQAYYTHGISLEKADTDGMEPYDVFGWFTAWAARVQLMIGHNINFDIQAMRILGYRATRREWLPSSPIFCTMTQAAPIMNLPPTARMIAVGRFRPKPPTLSECIEHFFGEELVGAHDAAADVQACIRVFQHLAAEKDSVN